MRDMNQREYVYLGERKSRLFAYCRLYCVNLLFNQLCTLITFILQVSDGVSTEESREWPTLGASPYTSWILKDEYEFPGRQGEKVRGNGVGE